MKRTQIVGICLILVLMLSAACTPKEAPVPAPKAPASAAAAAAVPAPAPVTPSQPAWEIEWDKTVAAAKKEGKVTLITSLGPLARTVVAKAFQSTFGIRSEWVAGGAGELIAKIMAERRARIYSVDATIIGGKGPYLDLKPAGILLSLDKVLFLPDLTDPQEIQKVWRFGLDWTDKERTILNFASTINIGVVVNTQLVQPGEIRAYRDLLAPKWREKIVLHDPTLSAGPGPTVIQTLGMDIYDWDFVRRLAEQKPVIIVDGRLQITWLAQGKYPIVLGARPEPVKEFLDLGTPVKILLMEEGETLTPGASSITVIKEAPHPNATKLFVNWLLSKEGQSIYTPVRGVPSHRLDISTEGVSSEMIPDPKRKYFNAGAEEWILKIPEAQKKAKEIFARLRG